MRRLLVAIYIPAALLAFSRGLLLPTLPLFADSFGISLSLVGLVLAAEALGMLLGDAPAGYLVNRLDPKVAMLTGVGIMTVAVFATGTATTVTLLLLSRIASGMGASLWNISRHAYLAHATVSHNRGRVMGLFAGVSRFGVFVGPVVGGAVAAAWGLRAPFFLYAITALLTLVLLWVLLPKEERPGGARVMREEGRVRRALARSRGDLINAGSGQLLLQLLRAGREVLIPLYASQILGLGALEVGAIVSAASLIDFALFYPAGVMMDRFGRKAVVVPSFVLQGLSLAAMPLTGGFGSLLLVASIAGFGNGISTGSMMTVGADLAPKEALAEFLAVWRLIGDAGFVTGPLVVGFVANGFGLPASSVTVGAIGAVVGATWFATKVPETLKREAKRAT